MVKNLTSAQKMTARHPMRKQLSRGQGHAVWVLWFIFPCTQEGGRMSENLHMSAISLWQGNRVSKKQASKSEHGADNFKLDLSERDLRPGWN